MTSLLRQYMVISLFGITLLLATLIYFYFELSDSYLRQHLDSHNKNLAVVLRNSLLTSGLEEELAAGGSSLSPGALELIESTLQQELQWVPVVKVKVYGRDSSVLYSTKTDEIGTSAAQNEAVQQALAGTAVSGQVEPDHLNEFDQVVEIENLHQQYIPIESPASGEIIGVFETYLNVYEVVRGVEGRQRIMFWWITAILVLFYLGLAVTFLRTHRRLRRETRQRQEYLDELQGMHDDLERRVHERTAELDQAKNFLQSVIDGIANPLLVIRPDFTIALMNRQARNLIPEGKDPAEYRYCYQVSHRLDEPCTRPDHPCSFAEVMEKGYPARVRHTHYDENDRPVIIDLLTTPLYSADGEFEGVIEVEHDVTQMVQMQSSVIASEARLQAIMDNVPDAILTCSSDHVIESTNRAARDLFHADRPQLVGKNLRELFADGASLDVFDSARATQRQTLLRRRDGSEFPADIWIGPLHVGDGNPRLIVVVRDVTGRIRAQRELDTTRQQYFHHDKMVAIGQLAAGILHEVGNPIAAIAGAAAEAKASHVATDADDAISRNLDLIEDQITRLGKITREIADFASPRPRERELLDLNGLLRSTARLLTYDRRFSSIDVKLELDRNLPAIVGVADQLTQVFMNLLINAMDACSANDGRDDNIRVTSELDGECVRVCVEDSGTGMSQETLARVMELFYTTKPVGKGSGMGLALCDTIVRAHKGTLTIESEEGVGTRVYVTLPLDIGEDEGDGEAPPEPELENLAR